MASWKRTTQSAGLHMTKVTPYEGEASIGYAKATAPAHSTVHQGCTTARYMAYASPLWNDQTAVWCHKTRTTEDSNVHGVSLLSRLCNCNFGVGYFETPTVRTNRHTRGKRNLLLFHFKLPGVWITRLGPLVCSKCVENNNFLLGKRQM